MSEEKRTLAEILAEEEEDELKWDYRLFTRREKKRFLQKKKIIQDNYTNNIDRLTNKVTFNLTEPIRKFKSGSCDHIKISV